MTWGLYLTGQGRQPQAYPWPFKARTSAALQQFMRFLQRMPEQDLKPWFTALEEEGFAKNIFAFYTLRSVPSASDNDLNPGLFIPGGR